MTAANTIHAPTYVAGHGLLEGRSVLITAAAGVGIGFAAARKAVEEGCRAIMISDIHERRLAEAASKLRDYSPTVEIHSQICNVTDEAQVQALVDAAEDRLGGIDVLINNAGLGGLKPVVEMTDEEWNLVLDVTLTGTMRMTRAVLRKMQPRGRGAIVNNASVLGWRAQKGQSHYAAAKAGVMAFTRCSAVEAAEHGIRINAVSPSIAMHDFLKRSAPQEQLDALAKDGPFGSTVAHGYLTFSLINAFLPDLFRAEGMTMAINYGCDRLRFPAPVPVNSRVRASAQLIKADLLEGNAVHTTVRVVIELEGSQKPGCVADIAGRYYFPSAA